jgi:AAHS family benzoate transporter-like MFS transporter
LLAKEMPLQQSFLIFAVPAAVSAVAMLIFAIFQQRASAAAPLLTATQAP